MVFIKHGFFRGKENRKIMPYIYKKKQKTQEMGKQIVYAVSAAVIGVAFYDSLTKTFLQ